MSKLVWELLCVMAERATMSAWTLPRQYVHDDFGRGVEDALLRDKLVAIKGHDLHITSRGMYAYMNFN